MSRSSSPITASWVTGAALLACAGGFAATCSVYSSDLLGTSSSGGAGPGPTPSSSESSPASSPASSSSSSSSSSGGGSGGSGGAGGGGCQTPAQCPDPMNECIKPVCNAGQCSTMNVADGTKTMAQKPGDCQVVECDGKGATKSVADDKDLPDDNVACTDNVCTNGVPSNPPKASGTPCGAGLVCDGNGTCAGCVMPSQCPGQDDECETRTCTAGSCGFSFTPNGTLVQAQVPADCKKNICNGNGLTVSANDDLDVAADGLTCTLDTCSNGTPMNPPVAAGLPCSQMGGAVCDGFGTCVQCVVPSDCPGIDTECSVRSCSGAGTCGHTFTALNTPILAQTAGDCQTAVCDGAGNIGTLINDLDVPVDPNQCTDDVCTMGAPSNPTSPPGTPCSQMGGTVCNAAGACVVPPATCGDGMKNGAETDIDCGGGTCPACGDFKTCGMGNDCVNGSCISSKCENAWINELHYDNTGADINEGVEIAGTAGLDLTGWVVLLYNGAGGVTYAPVPATALNLTGVIPNQQASKGTLSFLAGSLQNGAPDGLALVAPGNVVVQFLSYEGKFAATNGAAAGQMSVDIGVSETGLEAAGLSLQLTGTGSRYSDFVWAGPVAASLGAVNGSQMFN